MSTKPLLSLLLAAAVAAQGPEKSSNGPLVAVPQGLSIDPMTSPVTGDESKILVKRIGYYDDTSGGKPGEFPTPMPTLPDYRTSAILQGISPEPDVDAFSLGADWILSDGDGVMRVPPGHWGGLTFSIDRTSMGEAGSVIRQEYDDPAHRAGGDLFFYILPESTILPPSVLDKTYLAQDATEMDIALAGAPSTPEIDAHDLYLALVWAENPALASLLPTEVVTPPKAFFSVTDATKHLIPSGWWGGTSASGGTVFVSEWDGASAWSTPRVFMSYAEFGLTANEELDAVAIDLVRDEVLFSTKSPSRQELLWLPLGTDGVMPTPKTYRMPITSTPITSKAKLLQTDKIDGICALDPGVDPVLRATLGIPELPFALPAPLPPQVFPSESWASVYRTEGFTGLSYISTVVGWPPPGRQPGVAALLIAFPGQSPWIPVTPLIQRDVVVPVHGSPVEHELQVPPSPGLFGLDLAFQWVLVDQLTQQFDVPHLSLIQLQ